MVRLMSTKFSRMMSNKSLKWTDCQKLNFKKSKMADPFCSIYRNCSILKYATIRHLEFFNWKF